MYRCKICDDVEFDNYTSLSRHMVRTHKMDSIQFYVDYNLNGIWPTCKCGCEGKVKWSWELKGFRNYCQGHQSRVHNNWGHNKKAIDASAETRRIQYASGERIQWNKGLTKYVNESVKLNGKLRSMAYTPEVKKEYALRMKENRLNGVVPTRYGPYSSQWKGGVSEVNVMARSDKKMYEEWKYPILVRDGFKCIKCGSGSPLHVHHDKEQMCEIVKKHMPVDIQVIEDFELKKVIVSKIVDYHITNKISGVTLCSKCHNEIHPSLNFD